MSKTPTVGVIGCGFVGTAVLNGFRYRTDIKAFDKAKNINSLEEVLEQDVIFVCVPTPSNKLDGSCDTSVVEEVLDTITAHEHSSYQLVVIKSTIPPGFCARMQERHPSITITHSPEFLTERRASQDFATQTRVIYGTEPVGPNSKPPIERFDALRQFQQLFVQTFGQAISIQYCTWDEAALIKYATNCFLATKVALMNELTQICEIMNVSPQKVIDLLKSDGRISSHHMEVPGPDGKRGFGGSCFPKDMKALISLANEYGVNPKILEAALDKNIEVRNLPI